MLYLANARTVTWRC